MPLTDTAIRKLKPEAKRYRKTDSDGLIIEVTPNNKKVWRYRYQLAGKAAIYTIGDYPAISLIKARELRNERHWYSKALTPPITKKPNT